MCNSSTCKTRNNINIISNVWIFSPGACRLNDDTFERRKWKIFGEDADNSRPKEWKDVTFNNDPNKHGIMRDEYRFNKQLVFIYFTLIPLFRMAE